MSRWDKLRATIKTKADTKFEKRSGILKSGTNVPFVKLENTDHEFDIIPYKIGPNDPRIGKGYEVGDDHYTLEVYVNSKIGPASDEMVVCLLKTYGLPCPICEYYMNLQKNGEAWENYRQYMPNRYPRSLYNVKMYTNSAEEAKGIQVLHTSAYLLEIHLAKLASGSARNKGNYIYFADPEEGKSIAFTKEGQQESTKFTGIRFLDRDYKIDDETIKKTYCLDSLINVPTYGEVYKLFYGEECPTDLAEKSNVAAEPTKERTAIKSRGERKTKPEAPKPEPVKEEPVKAEVKEEPTNEEVLDIDTMSRKELIALIKEEKIDLGGDPSEFETDEIKAALRKMIDAPPAETKKEEPVKRKETPAKTDSQCPNGLMFGKDCDTTPDCEKCDPDLWKACTAENKKLRDASRSATPVQETKPTPAPTPTSTPSTGGSRLRRRG